MNRIARFPVLAAAIFSLLAFMTGCARLQARDQLNKGVQAYKSARYEEAIGHFQKAVNLDPSLPMAHLYLATAFAQQVVPDLTTPENLKNANLAIQGFQAVLDKDPRDVGSLKGIASIYYNIQQYDKAKDTQKKVLEIDPTDAEAAYTVGVIDWVAAHKNAVTALAAVGMTDDAQGNVKMPKATCQTLIQQNTPLVNEGYEYLQKAVQIRPTYDDAMSYLNLIDRRKADLECGNEAARKADLDQAADWVAKSLGTRKANEAKKAAATPGGVVMDNEAPK